ncbi:hypothetical protein E2C01_084655 [Portunus trituberculatus]|uniref:Uncharacterized protein n=1 Tax=Portunus trituberculatus TaxID=210409 RepID=A0A5B7J9V2_PORTR|nr:hypothetical protein [Portunus trituberculatus]
MRAAQGEDFYPTLTTISTTNFFQGSPHLLRGAESSVPSSSHITPPITTMSSFTVFTNLSGLPLFHLAGTSTSSFLLPTNSSLPLTLAHHLRHTIATRSSLRPQTFTSFLSSFQDPYSETLCSLTTTIFKCSR